MMNRLFITLDIPEQTIEEILTLSKELYGDYPVRWEGKDKLHITLKFLGDTKSELTEIILQQMNDTAKKFNKIDAEFNRFGMFFRNNSPKIFWIGLTHNPKVFDLQKEVEDRVSELGFKKEKRKFHPHLTLLRIKGRENIDSLIKIKNTKIDPIKFTAKQISLMKSELNPTGSVYSIIKSFELS